MVYFYSINNSIRCDISKVKEDMLMENYQGIEWSFLLSEEELENRRKSTMSKKYEEYIYEQNFYLDGWQTKYRFENGYGASVINHNGSYGLELGVLYDGVLDYSTPITSDVVPHIKDEEELDKLLKYIKELWELESEWED